MSQQELPKWTVQCLIRCIKALATSYFYIKVILSRCWSDSKKRTCKNIQTITQKKFKLFFSFCKDYSQWSTVTHTMEWSRIPFLSSLGHGNLLLWGENPHHFNLRANQFKNAVLAQTFHSQLASNNTGKKRQAASAALKVGWNNDTTTVVCNKMHWHEN